MGVRETLLTSLTLLTSYKPLKGMYKLGTGARRVVLATSIAESSLTVEGVRAVVDSGKARVPVQDDGTGLNRLVTVPASLASVDQRRGRAGALQLHFSFSPAHAC